MSDGELISVHKSEKKIFDLKFSLENKGGLKLKMVKCFGSEEYMRDLEKFYIKTKKFWEGVNADNTCYN
jgi:hypothetical protein